MSKEENKKENKSSEYLFIRRPKLAIVISLTIVLAGIITMLGLPLEEYPDITPPQVVVSAQYPGASADVIESTVAAPVEAQINGVEGMIYMSSSSQNGSYTLNLFFEIGSDSDMAVVNVQNRLQLVTPRLPEDVRRYGLSVRKSTGGAGLLLLSVNSPNNTYDPLFIANYASIYIKDEIARIKGVGNVSVFGSSDYSMRIWLDATKMAGLGVSTADVSSAVQQQNAQVPAGELGVEPLDEKQMLKVTLKTKGRLNSVSEFENIVVKAKPDGSRILLKDIARVQLGAESYSFFSRVNGRNNAIIQIIQLPEANSIDLANKVKKRLEVIAKGFPQGLEYQIIRDETEFVRESMKEVCKAIGLAIILVIIVTYLFLGTKRASLIPFCAIPVSLIGVFIFLAIMGFSINLLMLFGMVLAVGTVVDDAIVVLENVQRHIQMGTPPREATNVTMQEVTGAVVATSLVLMAVFVPVCFMPGITGRMYQQFAACIAISIGLSTIVALTLSPAMCSLILKSGEEQSDFDFINKFNDWFNKLRDKYLKAVRYFVESPKKTMITFLSLVLIAGVLFKLIPTGFLPIEDKGVLFTQIQLPDGSSASRTDEVAYQIETRIREMAGIKRVITMVGFSGENTAMIISELNNWSKRKGSKLSMPSILSNMRREFGSYPSATVVSFSPTSIPGLGMFGGFEYQLLDKGDRNPQQMYDEAMNLIKVSQQSPKITSMFTQYSANLPQLKFTVNESKAMSEGIAINEIYQTLSSVFGKSYINDFNKYGRVYRVMMQGDSDFRKHQQDIDKIYVKNARGQMVPLTSLVIITNEVGPYTIPRFNLYKSVTINGNAASGVSSGAAIKEMEKISAKNLPSDMTFAWSGSSLQEKESSGQIGMILAMALTFVYLFLVALYESWTLPLAVMLVSPIAIAGGLLFQYVAGYALDLYSQIGLVMLIGLSTKQAILIIEFAKEAEENGGLSVIEAAMEAAKLRFRAVIMTGIAFILGVVPLVLAFGAGAESRRSVGMTVIGGMIAVVCIGTLVVPAFYVVIQKMKNGDFNDDIKNFGIKIYDFIKDIVKEIQSRGKND